MKKIQLIFAIDSSRFEYMRDFGNSLQKFGFEVELINDSDFYNKIDKYFKFLKWIKTPKKFNEFLDKKNPDIIITERPYSNFTYLCVKNRLPLMIFLRGDSRRELDFEISNTKNIFKKMNIYFKKIIHDYCLTNSIAILPICKFLEKIVLEKFPNKKSYVLYQGINSEFWKSNSIKEMHSPNVGLLQNAIIWEKCKDMIFLKNIFNLMPDVNFYWAGDGPYAKNILNELNSCNNFKWLGGLKYPEQVKQFLNSIDVYMLFSGLDMFPHSVLEAQILGKPVIVSNIGGVSETIIDKKTGYLIKNDDVNGTIDKINSLILNKNNSEKMGLSGMQYVNENFCWDSIAKNFANKIKSDFFNI